MSYSYKKGLPGEIVGVEWVVPVLPPGMDTIRLCYHVRWSDGSEDWTPIEDKNSYEIISFDDICKGKIPPVQ